MNDFAPSEKYLAVVVPKLVSRIFGQMRGHLISPVHKLGQDSPKTKLAEDEIFLKLYCAALNGVASQLEQPVTDVDGIFRGDLFAEHLRHREKYLVARAFRLACLAREELQIEDFNQKV